MLEISVFDDFLTYFEDCKCAYGLHFYPDFSKYVTIQFSCVSCALYLVLVGLLTLAVKQGVIATLQKTNLHLKRFLFLYNVFQVVVCSYVAFSILPMFYFQQLGWNHTEPDKTTEFSCFIFYLTKYLDFLDTVIIILKGNWRQLSFLHVFHHATMPIAFANCFHCGWMYGFALWNVVLNSLVHVALYSHYTITSLGMKNPFRKYITKFQLTQFVILVCTKFVIWYRHPHQRIGAVQDFCYQWYMFYLFSRFYDSAYKKKKQREKEGNKKCA